MLFRSSYNILVYMSMAKAKIDSGEKGISAGNMPDRILKTVDYDPIFNVSTAADLLTARMILLAGM